jgi:hypothetical protein
MNPRVLRSLSAWTLFLGLDLVLASVICEVWIRCFIPVRDICYLTDPKLGVTFCPNQRTYGYVEPGYSNILVTNSAGLHDAERTLVKPPRTYRIEVYGDSMVQGYVVPVEATLTAVLERQLNSGRTDVKFEVLNIGTGDDGTASQIAAFEEIGRNYQPDLVICYFMDDFGDNLLEIHRREWSPYYTVADDGQLIYVPPIPKDLESSWERFKKASSFYRLMANKLLESKFYAEIVNLANEGTLQFRGESGIQSTSHRDAQMELCIKKGWPLTMRLLKRFNDVVRAEGCDFIVVDGRTLSPESLGTVYSNRDIESACQSKGIKYIRGYEEYVKLWASENPHQYFFRDNHPNVLGFELIGRELAEKIARYLNVEGGPGEGQLPTAW